MNKEEIKRLGLPEGNITKANITKAIYDLGYSVLQSWSVTKAYQKIYCHELCEVVAHKRFYVSYTYLYKSKRWMFSIYNKEKHIDCSTLDSFIETIILCFKELF